MKPSHKFEIHLHSDSVENVEMVMAVNGEYVTDLLKSATNDDIARLTLMVACAHDALFREMKSRETANPKNPNNYGTNKLQRARRG